MEKVLAIKLLYFHGCPNVGATKRALDSALKAIGMKDVGYDEIDIHEPACPENYLNYPSPTILINGEDMEGLSQGAGAACRLYDSSGGVPSVEAIQLAITKFL